MKKFSFILFTLFTSGITVAFFTSCGRNSAEGNILITRLPGSLPKADFISGESWRFPVKAQIVAVDKNDPGKTARVLTSGFYSACWPDVSYDGRFMIFAGQQTENDHWRIWEMNLSSLKTRAVTPAGKECTDPVYLPGNKLAFSMTIANDSLKAGHSICTCNLDGTGLGRITFNPEVFFALNTLADGRIVTAGRRIYPDTGAQRLMVLRPDGTKAELFYLPGNGGKIRSRIHETPDGKVVFTESAEAGGEAGKLSSIEYNRPLHSHKDLTSGITGSIINVLPSGADKYLVCYRRPDALSYGLYEFDPVKRSIGKSIYEDNGYNVLDAAIAEAHVRPKKLPSEVDMHVKSGLLMCQNINMLYPAGKNGIRQSKAVKIELLGIGKSLGFVDAEADGSFYIKPLADTPFRIRTIDSDGKTINSPCSWIYLRPNERRGCVGCHEDMEMTPENRIALAVKKKPVIVPVHIVKIKEKKVDLE